MCTAYTRLIEPGHADESPDAAFNLGLLLEQDGDLAGVHAVYERAIESGHADAAPWATRNLGVNAQGAR